MRSSLFLSCVFLLLLPVCLSGAEVADLVKQLDSDQEPVRTAALAELHKLGPTVETALNELEGKIKLSPRQLLLIRRILGDLVIARSTLTPLDLDKLAPLGEDKKNNIPGDPTLLFNKTTKVISMDSFFSIESGPLEYLAVANSPNARLHETVVAIQCRPRDICAAMLVCNYAYAELGKEGKIDLPDEAGAMISVEFLWEPPSANTEVNPDLGSVLSALKQKAALLAKAATPQERDRWLLDMGGDFGFLDHFIPYPQDTDSKQRKDLLGSLHALLPDRDGRLLHDAARRELVLKQLDEFVETDPNASAFKNAPAAPLPEKRLVRVPLEYFAWNTSTDNVMKEAPFAFTGSKFEPDPDTKKLVFMADLEGSIVACKFDEYAVLNSMLDTRNIDPQHGAGYAMNQTIVPRRLSRCRLILEPWTGKAPTSGQLHDIGDKKTGGMPASGAPQ